MGTHHSNTQTRGSDGRFSADLEERASVSDLLAPQPWFEELMGGASTDSGENINSETALRFSAVYSCINIISQACGSIPVQLNQIDSRGQKKRAQDHPLYPLLLKSPNEEHSRHEFVSFMMQQVLLHGNSYAVIERNGAGAITALVPLCTPDVTPRVVNRSGQETNAGDGRLVFEHTPSGGYFERKQILFFRNNMTLNGITGLSPISYARQNIGIALAAERYGARFYQNSARPGGLLTPESPINPNHLEPIKEQFKKLHQGSSNAHKLILLPAGLKYQALSLSPEDAAFLSTRRMEIEEVARIFRVPLHLLQDLTKATNNNVEQMSLDFLMHTLHPWVSMMEGAYERDLLSPAERAVLEFDFKTDRLIRVDAQTQAEILAMYVNNGLKLLNDARSEIGEPPVSEGDKPLCSVQTQSLEKVHAEEPAPAPPAPLEQEPEEELEEETEETEDSKETEETEDNRSLEEQEGETRAQDSGEFVPDSKVPPRVLLADKVAPFFTAAARQIVDWEIPRIRELLADHKEAPALAPDAIISFYEENRSEIESLIRPTYKNFTKTVIDLTKEEQGRADAIDFDDFLDEAISAAVFGWAERSKTQLIEDLSQEDSEAAIETRLAGWDATRSEVFSNAEHIKQQNKVARFALMALGVTALRWRTRGGCPLCKPLDGKVVGIRAQFVKKGDTHEGDEGSSPIKARQNIRHAPLHKGCRCWIEGA